MLTLRVFSASALVALALLCGCSPSRPFRTDLVTAQTLSCPQERVHGDPNCATATPEVDPSAYELHFVEFDDQGWPYPPAKTAAVGVGGDASSQIDHVMARLTALLQEGEDDLSLVLYVNGWKHNAHVQDTDVGKFRQLLKATGELEKQRHARPNAWGKPRKVIGIYVGWRGKSWELPGPLLNLTFWTRKSAAQRIAQGGVQELFSRLRTLQAYYNDPKSNSECAGVRTIPYLTRHCRIRSLMIGHSFGGWILYSAVAGALMQNVNASRDLPQETASPLQVQPIADLIVLINPAFEASRFEPLFEAARRSAPKRYHPPVLVMITSEADWANRYAFPAGRFFNTIFEHPYTTHDEEIAMKHTPGFVERYLTHDLKKSTDPCQKSNGKAVPESAAAGHASAADEQQALREIHDIEIDNSRKFFDASSLPNGSLRSGWARTFCGGVTLSVRQGEGGATVNPNAIVWNVRTDRNLIRDHNDITGPILIGFVRQLYDDTVLFDPAR